MQYRGDMTCRYSSHHQSTICSHTICSCVPSCKPWTSIKIQQASLHLACTVCSAQLKPYSRVYSSQWRLVTTVNSLYLSYHSPVFVFWEHTNIYLVEKSLWIWLISLLISNLLKEQALSPWGPHNKPSLFLGPYHLVTLYNLLLLALWLPLICV